MKIWQLIIFSLLVAVASLSVKAEESIASLRGTHDLNALSKNATEAEVILPDSGVHPRDMPHQPPMVPHSVEKVRISLMKNQCLGCHGKLEFEEVGATEIGKNHYINRAGEELGHISTRYYFCTQCHASQVNKDPLVENNFQSILAKKQANKK